MRDRLAINKSASKTVEADGHFPDEWLCCKQEVFLDLSSPCRSTMDSEPPPQPLVWKLRLMITHTHQKGMKRFITHIMRHSGEMREGFQVALNMAWKVSTCKVWTFWLRQSRDHLAFLIRLPRCGAEGRGRVVGFESCQQTFKVESNSLLQQRLREEHRNADLMVERKGVKTGSRWP